MPKTDYNKFCNDSKLSWKCQRSDCFSSDQKPINILMSKMSQLLDCVDDIKNKVDGLLVVPAKLDLMQSELTSISCKLSSLETRVSTIEDRLNDMEVRVADIEQKEPASKSSPEETIAEINDRSRRAHNLLVYNLPESSSTAAAVRMDKDMLELRKLLNLFAPDLSSEFKCYRVGRPQKDKIRPLKIIFTCAEHPKVLMSKFNKDDLIKAFPSFSGVTLSRDRTDRERQYLNQLRLDLEKRAQNGEVGLTIKYFNGVPSIVKSTQKN